MALAVETTVPRVSSNERAYAERVCKVMTAVVNELFSGNQTHASRALGISQPQISDVMSMKSGKVGLATLLALRDYTGLPIERLLGLRPPKSHRLPPSLRRLEAARTPPDPFEVGASAALLDRATDEDVEAVRAQPRTETLAWNLVREEIIAAKRAREHRDRPPDAQVSPDGDVVRHVEETTVSPPRAARSGTKPGKRGQNF